MCTAHSQEVNTDADVPPPPLLGVSASVHGAVSLGRRPAALQLASGTKAPVATSWHATLRVWRPAVEHVAVAVVVDASGLQADQAPTTHTEMVLGHGNRLQGRSVAGIFWSVSGQRQKRSISGVSVDTSHTKRHFGKLKTSDAQNFDRCDDSLTNARVFRAPTPLRDTYRHDCALDWRDGAG